MNPAAFQRFNARVQMEAENLFPGSITIAGQNYACAAAPKATSVDTDPLGGGFRPIQPLVVRVRKDLLAADGVVLVERETRVGFEGQEYRLISIGGKGSSDPAWYLTLASPAKG